MELTPIEGSKPAIPRAPSGLKAEGKRLWRSILTAYDFEGCPEKLIVLENAARTADVVDRLQKVVDEADELRVRGSQGQPVAAPEVSELRQYRAQLAVLIKGLMLPDEDEQDGHLTKSQIGRLGAQARWGNRRNG
jgi:hypothetical protein